MDQNFIKNRIEYKISGSSMHWEQKMNKWRIKNFKKQIFTNDKKIEIIEKKDKIIDLNVLLLSLEKYCWSKNTG